MIRRRDGESGESGVESGESGEEGENKTSQECETTLTSQFDSIEFYLEKS